MIIAFLLTASFGFPFPGTSGSYPDVDSSGEARREARFAHEAVRIDFEPGDAFLSPIGKVALRELVTVARKTGPLGVVFVAAWSDEDSPQPSTVDLSAAEKRLADGRARAIANFLRADFGIKNITTYNMAVGSSRLEAGFNTAEAELKAILAGEREAPEPGTRVELLQISDLGAAGSVVVVVEHKVEPRPSH